MAFWREDVETSVLGKGRLEVKALLEAVEDALSMLNVNVVWSPWSVELVEAYVMFSIASAPIKVVESWPAAPETSLVETYAGIPVASAPIKVVEAWPSAPENSLVEPYAEFPAASVLIEVVKAWSAPPEASPTGTLDGIVPRAVTGHTVVETTTVSVVT